MTKAQWIVKVAKNVTTKVLDRPITDRYGETYTPVRIIEHVNAKRIYLDDNDDWCETFLGNRAGLFDNEVDVKVDGDGRCYVEVPRGKNVTVVQWSGSQSCRDGAFTARHGYTTKIRITSYGK